MNALTRWVPNTGYPPAALDNFAMLEARQRDGTIVRAESHELDHDALWRFDQTMHDIIEWRGVGL